MRGGVERTTTAEVEALQKSALGSDFEDAVLQRIAGLGLRTEHGKDDLIDGAGILLLVRGSVQRVVSLAENATLILGHCRRTGDVVTVGNCTGLEEALVQVRVSSEKTVTLFWSWDQVVALGRIESGLQLRLHQIGERQEAQSVAALLEVIRCGLTARVAHAIAQCAADGEAVPTHREVAEWVGARPENVAKVLHRLQDEELIAFLPHHTRSVVVLELARLRQY